MRSYLLHISNFFSFLLVALLFLHPVVYAQGDAGSIKKQFEEYAQNNLQEKIFVHTDKSFYLPGEVIWFKAYVVDARFNIPIDLSKVAYVEILDRKNNPVLQTKIELKKGSGSGSFLLPVSVSTGNFTLRAYTRWMRNFNADLFFRKPITIINTLKNPLPELASPAKYDIQFFPEGGSLVQHLTSKVAFKITDQYGKGIQCDGIVRNQANDSVVHFKTYYNGTGNFFFTPATGDTYTAYINIRKDSAVKVVLPASYESGYVMHLDEVGDNLRINVTTGNKPAEQLIYLLSHTRQKINTAEQKTTHANQAVFLVNKTSLPAGVTVFTIFNDQKQPVCERLYFKKPVASSIEIKTDGDVYHKRSKVSLRIEAKEEGTQQEFTDLSLAVYKLDSLQTPDNFNIAGYLWLTSELNGRVENPEYYFKNQGPAVDSAVDNLLLTQGWRRYKWEDILGGKKSFFEFIPEYEGHLIAGKVTNKQSSVLEENVTGYLSAPAKKYQFTAAVSNNKGDILFNTKDFIGTDQLVLQTDRVNTRIEILNPYSENYPKQELPPLPVFSLAQNQLLNHSINSQVQTTYFNDSLNKFYYPFTDTTHFYGKAYNSYPLDKYIRFTTMEDVLREYVTEVAPRKQNKKFHLYVLKNPHEFFEKDPLVLVDGVPVFDMDSVMAIDPLKIQKLEVLTREYHAGPVTATGIVSFSTYNGDLAGINLNPNTVVVEYDGLQLKREFYAPAYETAIQKNNHTPDFRNVLLWSPDITTDKQGKAAISLYTSDVEGKYFIILQGVSTNGKIFYTTSGFEVKK